MISPELLSMLRCPRCHTELSHQPDAKTLTCRKCWRIYRVDDDVPVMIADEEEETS